MSLLMYLLDFRCTPLLAGLEWQHVFLFHMNEGECPIAGALGMALEEERRLAFVGLTRAKVLIISGVGWWVLGGWCAVFRIQSVVRLCANLHLLHVL